MVTSTTFHGRAHPFAEALFFIDFRTLDVECVLAAATFCGDCAFTWRTASEMTERLTFVTAWKHFLARVIAYGNNIFASMPFGEVLNKCFTARAEFDAFGRSRTGS